MAGLGKVHFILFHFISFFLLNITYHGKKSKKLTKGNGVREGSHQHTNLRNEVPIGHLCPALNIPLITLKQCPQTLFYISANLNCMPPSNLSCSNSLTYRPGPCSCDQR